MGCRLSTRVCSVHLVDELVLVFYTAFCWCSFFGGWGRGGGGGEQVSMVLVCWELMLFLLIFLLDFTQSTTNCTIIPYPKKIQKIYESRDKTFEFCWHQYFFAENQLILLYQEIGLLIHKDFFTPFDTSFLFISTFLESLRIVIINMDKVLMMSAKMPLFWGLVLVQVQ